LNSLEARLRNVSVASEHANPKPAGHLMARDNIDDH
jgi:hypothetical protein